MEIIFDENIKTRKLHRCWGCTQEIPIGTVVNKTTTIDNGTICHAYWCKTCEKFWDTLDIYDKEYGIEYGELKNLENYPAVVSPQ